MLTFGLKTKNISRLNKKIKNGMLFFMVPFKQRVLFFFAFRPTVTATKLNHKTYYCFSSIPIVIQVWWFSLTWRLYRRSHVVRKYISMKMVYDYFHVPTYQRDYTVSISLKKMLQFLLLLKIFHYLWFRKASN